MDFNYHKIVVALSPLVLKRGILAGSVTPSFYFIVENSCVGWRRENTNEDKKGQVILHNEDGE